MTASTPGFARQDRGRREAGVGVSGNQGARRGVRAGRAVALDRLLDVVYLVAAMVLVLIARAGLAGIGTSLAGPLPLAGPVPGF